MRVWQVDRKLKEAGLREAGFRGYKILQVMENERKVSTNTHQKRQDDFSFHLSCGTPNIIVQQPKLVNVKRFKHVLGT